MIETVVTGLSYVQIIWNILKLSNKLVCVIWDWFHLKQTGFIDYDSVDECAKQNRPGGISFSFCSQWLKPFHIFVPPKDKMWKNTFTLKMKRQLCIRQKLIKKKNKIRRYWQVYIRYQTLFAPFFRTGQNRPRRAKEAIVNFPTLGFGWKKTFAVTSCNCWFNQIRFSPPKLLLPMDVCAVPEK